MDHPFLTGFALGSFLTAAFTVWWCHFAGAVYVSAWRQRLADKIRGWIA
jgi:hypothetical protein